ncbi:CD209 antigen-like protein A isoform X2, partial [Leptotrombidium deliense]
CYQKNQSGLIVAKCYYFEKFQVTFKEANELCKSMNATLLSINDEEENEFVNRKIIFNENYWTAAVRIIRNQRLFAFINGEIFDYTRWAKNEPQHGQSLNCVRSTNGLWFASDCSEKYSFICEATFFASNSSNIQSSSLSASSLIDTHSKHLMSLDERTTKANKYLNVLKARDTKIVELMTKIIDGEEINGDTQLRRASNLKRVIGKRSVDTSVTSEQIIKELQENVLRLTAFSYALAFFNLVTFGFVIL